MNTSTTVSLVHTVQELLLKIKIAFFEDNGGVQGRLCFFNCSTVAKIFRYVSHTVGVPVTPISRSSVMVIKENCTLLGALLHDNLFFSYYMVITKNK